MTPIEEFCFRFFFPRCLDGICTIFAWQGGGVLDIWSLFVRHVVRSSLYIGMAFGEFVVSSFDGAVY